MITPQEIDIARSIYTQLQYKLWEFQKDFVN